MSHYLAQLNIAKMLAPLDSPVMADFVNNLDRINALAESSEGFVWRLKDDENNATSIKIYNDDFLIVNMSVWKDIDSLFGFVYQTQHLDIFKRRSEWFENMKNMHMALWYIEENHRPTIIEAQERLDYLRANGDTPFAFTFKKRFSIEEYFNFRKITVYGKTIALRNHYRSN
jgi:hypothetical protein